MAISTLWRRLAPAVLLLLLALLDPAHGASPLTKKQRIACQSPTPNPLKGCPKGTLLVDPNANGSSPTNPFSTIQSAVLSIPNNTDPYVILIQPGNYTEQVNVTRQGPLTLLGVTEHPNDYTRNTVNVIWHNATGTATTGTYDNAYTSTLTVAPYLFFNP